MTADALSARLLRAAAAAGALAIALAGCAEEAPAPRPLGLEALEPGMCFDLGEDLATAVVAPDCGWAHDYEAAAVLELEGDAYPGEEALDAQADADCAAAFAAYTGRVLEAAPELRAAYLGPSRESWAEGDRALVCVVASGDGLPRSASAADPAASPAPAP